MVTKFNLKSCSNQLFFKVYIKEIFINGVLKDFTPIWIDSDADIENDSYTSDCKEKTKSSKPHAYSQFSITNGEMTSKECIEKPPGKTQAFILIKSKNSIRISRHCI